MARDLTEEEEAVLAERLIRAERLADELRSRRDALRALGIAPAVERPAPAAARWGIVELLGHRRLYGLVGERELASGTFLTVQVPTLEIPASDPIRVPGTDQWHRYPARRLPGFAVTVGPSAVYAITVLDGTSEEAEAAVRARIALDLHSIVREWPFPVPSEVGQAEPCEAPGPDADDDGNADIPW